MTARAESTAGEIEQQVAISVLQEQVKSGQAETSRRLERIEKKIDEQHYVSVSAFEAYVSEAKGRFVTKEEFKPVKWFFYTAGGAIIGAAAVAAVSFALKGGLQ